ncbi:hypothetical protein F5Y15DRAFT_368215, partial [Xylariaceae sp. FL0016]
MAFLTPSSRILKPRYHSLTLPEPKRINVLTLLFNATTEADLTIVYSEIRSILTCDHDWMNTIVAAVAPYV